MRRGWKEKRRTVSDSEENGDFEGCQASRGLMARNILMAQACLKTGKLSLDKEKKKTKAVGELCKRHK